MFAEDMSVFFFDFGKSVVWAPEGGEEQRTIGLVDAPDFFALSEKVIVGKSAELTYDAGALVGLDEDDVLLIGAQEVGGQWIGGKRYRVKQPPQKFDDGALMKALVVEVS